MTTAILDACVLYPPSLRDLLMWLASVRVYSPKWTEEIHQEWIRNVLKNHPKLTYAQLDRTRRLMNQVTPDCLVSNYEVHIPTLNLPDADDRHVLAAAIEAKASRIITFNLSDFPNTVLRAYNIQAIHPDPFLCALFDAKPEPFLRGLQAHRESLKAPSKTIEEYIQPLKANGLKGLTQRIKAHSTTI